MIMIDTITVMFTPSGAQAGGAGSASASTQRFVTGFKLHPASISEMGPRGHDQLGPWESTTKVCARVPQNLCTFPNISS